VGQEQLDSGGGHGKNDHGSGTSPSAYRQPLAARWALMSFSSGISLCREVDLRDRGLLGAAVPTIVTLPGTGFGDQDFRLNAQPVVSPADHGQRQRSLPVQHFVDPIALPMIGSRSLMDRPLCSIRNLIASTGSGAPMGTCLAS